MTVGDMIVIAVLVLVVVLIVHGMVRDRKKGKCSGCSGCSACGSCKYAGNGCPGKK